MENRGFGAENWAEMPIVVKDTKNCIGYYRPSPGTNRIVSELQKLFNNRELSV
ncbi:MAG: hypothetical protein KGH65_00865 [Candidatus Micrarchaeota archaeon]|nr:hypothetical protein [Candidatus Micrarchaeota archaeon]